MYNIGKQSSRILSQAHSDWDKVVKLALSWGLMDFSVVESFRCEAEQNRYHQIGKSKVPWPFSKHNKIPSDAVDLVPYINGKGSYNWNHCIFLAGVIQAAGKVLGIEIKWGGNWDRDGEPITDQDFQDLVHFERVSA